MGMTKEQKRMADKKARMADKNERRRLKHEKLEKLTNWYMINLCWGVFAIIILKFIDNGYLSGSTIGIMNPLLWVVTALLAVGAVVVFVLGKKGIIKNFSRAKNYTIFLGVSTIGSLLVVLYPQIRSLLMKVIPALSSVHSSWRVYWIMIAIVVYLIAAFIYYLVKSHKIRVNG